MELLDPLQVHNLGGNFVFWYPDTLWISSWLFVWTFKWVLTHWVRWNLKALSVQIFLGLSMHHSLPQGMKQVLSSMKLSYRMSERLILGIPLWSAPRQKENFYDLPWGREVLVSVVCLGNFQPGLWMQKYIFTIGIFFPLPWICKFFTHSCTQVHLKFLLCNPVILHFTIYS